MIRYWRSSLALLALLVLACEETESPVELDRPTQELTRSISGSSSQAGLPGFHFRPPIASSGPAGDGPFDTSLLDLLAVEICEWDGETCGPIVRTLTSADPPPGRLTVDETEESYQAVWRTKDDDLDPQTAYRIRVLATGGELGYADVDIVDGGSRSESGDPQEGGVVLRNGRTLPIAFRIEEDLGERVGAEGGEVSFAESRVRLLFPEGALAGDVFITATPAIDLPSDGPPVVPSTAWDFGPDGLGFDEPVSMVLTYDDADLPPGTDESQLRIHELMDGAWVPLAGSAVDESANSVMALVDGFSVFAVLEADGALASRRLAPGSRFTCGLDAADAAYCWGRNDEGQLGNGTTTPSASPVAVAGGLVFQEVTAGAGHACGRDAGGSAYCWGDNGSGQLGDGTTTSSTTPVLVAGGFSFVQITAGWEHTCGLEAGGTVRCWGANGTGQLGIGTTTEALTPSALTGAPAFTSIVAGGFHTCGVDEGGDALCWGSNHRGQLGDGTTVDRTTPVQVQGGLSFVQLAASGQHTCGLDTSGVAFCWGFNINGQLGDGTDELDRTSPVAVQGGLSFVDLSAGLNLAAADQTCGVDADGAAFCWGSNHRGQLGDGTTMDSNVPVPVGGGLTFVEVSAGDGHTCGVESGGTIYCWGGNASGELGTGGTLETSTPLEVAGGQTFVQIAAGIFHTCALGPIDSVHCWGNNGRGQLGDATTSSSASPVGVSGGITFTTVAAGGGVGGGHTCGSAASGAAFCWGFNSSGQLGTGAAGGSSAVPDEVAGGHTFGQLTLGRAHTCGLDATGQAFCWGLNTSGQLGDGTTTSSTSPVVVSGGITFTTIIAGTAHTCGIAASGAAFCWGLNNAGQLGDGSISPSNVPVPVAGGLTFVGLAAGGFHTCARDATGGAHCWGFGGRGQLGDGTTTAVRTAPVAVAGGLSFQQISAGDEHTCAVESTGGVFCWGLNDSGQLGGGTTATQSSTPVAVVGGLSFEQVAAGDQHTCALGATGSSFCWGSNGTGQLGDGRILISPVPLPTLPLN